MAEQKINSGVLTEKATNIEESNKNLDGILEVFTQKINTLNRVWEGDAQSALVKQFAVKLQPRFEEYSRVIISYCEYLRTTAADYEKLEAGLTNEADVTSDWQH